MMVERLRLGSLAAYDALAPDERVIWPLYFEEKYRREEVAREEAKSRRRDAAQLDRGRAPGA